ncbi:MAG: hypothetical protein KAU03_02950, partial [Candidatus Altiarchaeales archaeon]|nr:hypothetical protein [Candidatus Altiarchaeales archaeon]
MPFTPFHLGPALLIGLIMLPILDLPTFLVASVIVDIEPVAVLFLKLDAPLHGVVHTFLAGTLLAFILALIMFFLREKIKTVMRIVKLEQSPSFNKILLTSLAGVYVHILLDSFIYTDIKPFYLLTLNPLYGLMSPTNVCLFCI